MSSRLPPGYRGLVVCDTRRAEEWRAGLARAGFAVALAETVGRDSEKGAWQVGVAEADAAPAQALVTAVLQGKARLPSPPFLSRTGLGVLVAVVVLGAAIVVAAWLAR